MKNGPFLELNQTFKSCVIKRMFRVGNVLKRFMAGARFLETPERAVEG